MNKEKDIVDYETESILRPSVQRILTDVFQKTVQFKENSGLNNKIVRVSSGKCCELCTKIAGEYMVGVDELDNAHGSGVSVFFRHNKCDCLVSYHSEKGIQNVHDKTWYSNEEYLSKLQNLTQSSSTDSYIREVPLFLGNKGLKYYTEEEINLMAAETKRLVEKHGLRESKWSGRIIIDNKKDKWGKLWTCDILMKNQTAPHILLHEQIHATSVSYFNEKVYVTSKKIEEGCVELMATEISKKEKILIVDSKYGKYVNALKSINKCLKLFPDNYSFAKKLIKMDLPDRLPWLDNQIQSAGRKGNITPKEYQYLIKQLDKLAYVP